MSEKPVILAVNKNRRNLDLLVQFLGKAGYAVAAASDVEAFTQTLAKREDIQLALVDITGFDRHIWEPCETLRQKDIPLLIISPKLSRAIQQEGIRRGAKGVLSKPLATGDLLGLIRQLLNG